MNAQTKISSVTNREIDKNVIKLSSSHYLDSRTNNECTSPAEKESDIISQRGHVLPDTRQDLVLQ